MISPLITPTPHHTQTVSFAIIKLFLLFNTTAKTNHTDNKRPAPLSMNELTTEYWNCYTIWNYLISLFGLLYLSAMHRICTPAGAIVSAAHAPN